MPTPHDILLARITEAYGLVSAEDVARCLAEQEAARARAEPVSLGAVMVKLEVLSPFQRAGLEDLIRQDALGQDNIPTDRLAGQQAGASGDPAAGVDDTPSTRLLPARNRSRDGQDQGPQAAVIAGYAVIRELGRGGMGVVYEALQIDLVRRVALKVLSEPSLEPEAKERHRREALAAAKLSHPNVVRIYDCGEIDGMPYISMEYVPGVPMSRLIGDPEITFLRAASLIVQAADGLSALHAMGVIHRDIKPANLLVTPDARVLVTDFGLAKDAAATTITRTNQIMGTPRYMSPEQAEGASDQIDHRTDIYSLGATLYELATGKPIFDDAVGNVLHQVLLKEPKKPRVHRKDITKDYETVILKAIAKDSADRYQTASEFAEDLHRLIAGRPVLARPLGLPEKLWRLMRRNPAVTLLILVVLMITGSAVSVAVDRARARAEEADREGRRRQSLELIRQAQELTERVKVIVNPDATLEEEEAAAAAARQRFTQALGLLDQAEVLDPECAQAYRMEAELYYCLFDCNGAASAALAQLRKIAGPSEWMEYLESKVAMSGYNYAGATEIRASIARATGSLTMQAVLRATTAIQQFKPEVAIRELSSSHDWSGWESERYRLLAAAYGCTDSRTSLLKSIDCLHSAVAIGPSSYFDHINLCRYYKSIGELDLARTAVLNATGYTLDPVVAYLELGALEADRKQFARARHCYDRAMRLAPSKSLPLLFSADLHIQMNEFEAAERDLRLALSHTPSQVIPIHTRILELYRKWKGHDAAVDHFSEAFDSTATLTVLIDAETWPSVCGLVDELLDLGLFGKAIEILDRFSTKQKRTYDYFISRGHAHFGLREDQLALADFTRAIALAPTKTKNFVWRSRVYARLKQHPACIKDLSTAIELDPDNRDLYLKRATRYFEILRLQPGIRDVAKVAMMSQLGEVESIRDAILGRVAPDWTRTITPAVRAYAVQALPTLAAHLVATAEHALNRQDLVGAESALVRARVIDPRSFSAAYGLARLHARRGEWDLGILRLKQALDLGFSRYQEICSEVDFQLLRTRPEFDVIQQMIADLERK